MRMRKSRERREKPTQMDQPAEKRRRLGENEYKRVIQNSNKQEKRKDEEVQVENKPKTFQIFNIKRRKMNETPEIEKAAQEVIEIEERDWDRVIWLREEEMKKKAEARSRRIAEAKRKEKSYELLRLCKKIMELEGSHWKKSQERREVEKREAEEKRERLNKAEAKKRKTLHKIKCNKIQEKITSSLMMLPENERKLIRMRENREKAMVLREARREIWSRWRQNKGRKVGEKTAEKARMEEEEAELERRLSKISEDLKRKEQEQERRRKKDEEKNNLLERKRKKLQHWEMLRWIVGYIDKNKQNWEDKRIEEVEKREEEEKREQEMWEKMQNEEKIATIKEEETKLKTREPVSKEQRLQKAIELKRLWREERSGKEKEEEEVEVDPAEPE